MVDEDKLIQNNDVNLESDDLTVNGKTNLTFNLRPNKDVDR